MNKTYSRGVLVISTILLLFAGLISHVMAGDALNAKVDFGAVGDGVADDTAELQAWLNACKAQNKSGYLPTGYYKISSTLQLVGPMYGWKIEGDGCGISAVHSTIFWAGPSGGTMFLLRGISYGELFGIELNGSSIAGIGLDYDAIPGVAISTKNVFRSFAVQGCTDRGVMISKSYYQTDQTSWYDCVFRYNNIGVSIQDANAVWHSFYNVTCAANGIGITAIYAGNGGHFNVYGGRFASQTVCDLQVYPARACVLSGCQSELSAMFLTSSGNGSILAHSTTLLGCTVAGLSETNNSNGIGISWFSPCTLIIQGGEYHSKFGSNNNPFRINAGNAAYQSTVIADGVNFRDGNPWDYNFMNLQYAKIIQRGCTYASAVASDNAYYPSIDGPLPFKTPSTAGALTTSASTTFQTFGVPSVWVKIPSGTTLTAGVNRYYIKNKNCNGKAAVMIRAIQSMGGADTAVLGIYGYDNNSSVTGTGAIVVRCASNVTLTSDMIFSVLFSPEPVTY